MWKESNCRLISLNHFLCGYKMPIKNNNNITHWIISRKFVTMSRFSGFFRFKSSPDANEEVKLKVQMTREKLKEDIERENVTGWGWFERFDII